MNGVHAAFTVKSGKCDERLISLTEFNTRDAYIRGGDGCFERAQTGFDLVSFSGFFASASEAAQAIADHFGRTVILTSDTSVEPVSAFRHKIRFTTKSARQWETVTAFKPASN